MKTKVIFLCVILAVLTSCSSKNKSNCIIVKNGSYVLITANDLRTDTTFYIDLSSEFDMTNSFELDLLGRGRFFLPSSFRIAVYPHNDEIVKAERVVEYFPSIWKDSYSVYLHDFGYSSVQELEVRGEYIYYSVEDESNLRNDTNFIKHFSSISKQDLINAIKGKPEKNDLLVYSDEYKKGDFIEKHYEPFDIVPEKEEINVYYKIDGKDIMKSFYTIHSVRHR